MSSKIFTPIFQSRKSLSSQLLSLKSTTPNRCFQGRPRIIDPKTQAKKDSLREIEVALKKAPVIPPYPYGLQNWGNAYQPHPLAGKALLGGAQIQSGNKISKGRNKGKTRRKWHPYIQAVKVWSEAMNTEFTILATRSCMRTIQKCGGLDQYLLGEKPARLKELGPFGWKMRWLVLNSEAMSAKHAEQLTSMNIAPVETFEEALANPELRQRLLSVQSEAWQKLKQKEERFEKLVKDQWEAKDKNQYKFQEGTTMKNLDPSLLDMSEILSSLEISEKR